MEGLQKTQDRTTVWSINSTPRYKAKENENSVHPSVHNSIIYNCQGMEGTRLHQQQMNWLRSCGMCTHTHTHTHTQMEYYSAIKKKEILPCATVWVDLESTICGEIRERWKMNNLLPVIYEI